MSNFVSLCIKPCTPSPIDGYGVKYRPVGSSAAYRTWPHNFAGPDVLFEVQADPDGTQYEGFVFGDCGATGEGVMVPWTTATGESSGTGSASASSEAPGPVGFEVNNSSVNVQVTAVTVNGQPVRGIAFPVLPGQDVFGSTDEEGPVNVVVTLSMVTFGQAVIVAGTDHIDGPCQDITFSGDYPFLDLVSDPGGTIEVLVLGNPC